MSTRDSGLARFFVRPRVTLVALVLASLTLVTISYRSGSSTMTATVQSVLREITTPIRNSMDSIVHPVEDVVSGAFNYSSLKQQNTKLKEQVATLKTQALLSNRFQSELANLTRLANIPFAQGLPATTALVDNYSPSNTQMTVDLDKGSSSGIKVGQPVVASLGLVGRVSSVTSHSCSVLLISDPLSSIGVSFGAGNHQALAVGVGSLGSMKVELVNPGTSLTMGEPMYTSGMQGGIFPPNIPVGFVSKVSTTPGALQESVTIRPMVDLGHLEYVKILSWLPSGGG